MLRSAASPGSRGVRPVARRYEWPPHDAASDRPPLLRLQASGPSEQMRRRRSHFWRLLSIHSPVYLIFVSRNSTCFFATGSYFFLTSLSVMVREFLRVT